MYHQKRMIKIPSFCLLLCLLTFACTNRNSFPEKDLAPDSLTVELPESKKTPIEIVIEKELLYDQHTLADEYPYKDTVRVFQWKKIRDRLYFLDSIRIEHSNWAILQNYKNLNGEAPLIRTFVRNAYKRVADTLGVERYQSVPLYLPSDTMVAERYGRDGSPVRYRGEVGDFARIEMIHPAGEWLVPRRYVKEIGDTVAFNHVVFVDRHNQNIATMEKNESKWLIRSMNPATTGLHHPPYAQETPLGIFLIQEKKARMEYYKDGSTEKGGFAPWASRFTNGAYLHGVPVNAPHTTLIEYSASLGTTPRSHMCVRNATSHAKFVYDWAPVNQTVVFVLE